MIVKKKYKHPPPLFGSLLSALIGLLLLVPSVEAAEQCSDAFYINETLANGSRWDMCWEHRFREGITFKHINYTPRNGQRRLVLNHAAVAQIHVPYDDNGTRFHDVSDLGIGHLNMLDLNPDECPGGTLLKLTDAQVTNKNVLCKKIDKQNIAFRNGTNTSSGNSLDLFSVSPVGSYFYIPKWRFFDDGTIEAWMGATGALQRFGTDGEYGWELGDGRIGVSHLHNYYWKLDFDLNGTHKDDVVEEFNYNLSGGKRSRTITSFSEEAARKVNPNTMRHWRVRDGAGKNANGHFISYDIHLGDMGHQDIGPASEPFTHNDFYVTKQNSQEKFASHNTVGAKNLAEYVNGESLVDDDIVVWAGLTFYHVPRAEDAPHMDVHWSHLRLVPRDWNAKNPLTDSSGSNAPVLSSPGNQSSKVGDNINLNIIAVDDDGDPLSYSAAGLPAGLNINSGTGLISGKINKAETYNVTITVSDGGFSDITKFDWKVASNGGSGSGGGALDPRWLPLLFAYIVIRLYSNKNRHA